MAGIKKSRIKVHPLFYLVGVYYVIIGRFAEFVISTAFAIVHELGHSYVSVGLGYRLNKITLMPFGAVVSGDVEGLKLGDQIKIALAGPFINLSIGLFFVAVWWIYPESYAFTDVIAQTNFSLALINFLPVFPLDGGRVLQSVLGITVGKTRAKKICTGMGVGLSAVLLAVFISTLFRTPNVSIAFFGLFTLFGSLSDQKENKYVKVCEVPSRSRLMRGMEYKKQAIDKNTTVRQLFRILDVDSINEIVVYENGKAVASLSQERITEILKTGDIYAKIGKYL